MAEHHRALPKKYRNKKTPINASRPAADAEGESGYKPVPSAPIIAQAPNEGNTQLAREGQESIQQDVLKATDGAANINEQNENRSDRPILYIAARRYGHSGYLTASYRSCG